MKRNIYLDNISVETATQRWQEALTINLNTERIDIREAAGRRLAKAVRASCSSPAYNASAMDGIALRSKDTVGANERNPICLQEGNDYKLIDTGDPLPQEFDAVLMIEKVNQIQEGLVEIEESVTPGQNVRAIGESLVKGELILVAGTELGPYEIASVLEGGVTEVTVYTQPQVEIIATGSELVKPGIVPKPGQIIEYNSEMVKNLAFNCGAKVISQGITPDKYELIREKVQRAAKESDLVVIIAGSSAGREDYTAQVVADLGEVLVHGVSIKPGGPVILGKIENTAVLGLPGYPVAAALNFRLFARPLLYQLTGRKKPPVKEVKAVLNKKLLSKLGFREFVRVKLVEIAGELRATPLARSSGIIGSLATADGLVTISEFSEGFNKAEEVTVELLRNNPEPENTIIISGSSDKSLDILKDQLAQQGIALVIDSTTNRGGLTNLYRKEAHLAVFNLLADRQDYLEKYLSAQEQTFNLDFIPLGQENYNLVIPKEYLTDQRIKKLLKLIRSLEFKEQINSLAGYDNDR